MSQTRLRGGLAGCGAGAAFGTKVTGAGASLRAEAGAAGVFMPFKYRAAAGLTLTLVNARRAKA